MTGDRLTVGIVGATGAAGAEIARQLTMRAFPMHELRLFGTVRSAGAIVDEDEVGGTVQLLEPRSGAGLDVVFFAAGPAVARAHAPAMADAGALVVDVSSAFRGDATVPLVVPEVNGTAAVRAERGILAVPSPTTTLLAAVLAPLDALRRVTRAVVSTYQGAGTAGTRTLRALARETIALLGGRGEEGPGPGAAFDCRPLIGALGEDGVAAHEQAVGEELGRVLAPRAPALEVTAVRVPVFTGLAASVVAELDSPVAPAEVADALRCAPGLLVHAGAEVPTPRSVAGSPAVHVGRVRRDRSHPAAIALWVAADGVVKGRAGAAVSVAEIAIRARRP
jgi:aspartate-semialdehyde dehydrogenase